MVCRLCFQVVTHQWFDPAILALIILNMILICMAYRSVILPLLPCPHRPALTISPLPPCPSCPAVINLPSQPYPHRPALTTLSLLPCPRLYSCLMILP